MNRLVSNIVARFNRQNKGRGCKLENEWPEQKLKILSNTIDFPALKETRLSNNFLTLRRPMRRFGLLTVRICLHSKMLLKLYIISIIN